MKTIFIHGSGQRANSWDKVLSEIEYKDECLTPDLRDILKGKPATYKNLYGAFKSDCDQFEEKINIVGLSLGGIWALEYRKVKSLIFMTHFIAVPTRKSTRAMV